MVSSPKSSQIEINTFYGKCRFCLEYGYMKNMWSEYERDGLREIYGEILKKTFSVTWQSEDDSRDYICEPCVLRLQDAYDFKKEVLASKKLIDEYFDEAEVGFKVDVIEDNEEIKQENVLDNDFEGDKTSASETEYYEVEYLENDVESNTDTSDPTIKDTLDEHKAKEAEYLQKARRQAYKQYSEEVMKQCLDDVRENKMSVYAASKFYGLPMKTVQNKYKKELKNKKPGIIVLPNTPQKRTTGRKKHKSNFVSEKMVQIINALLEYSNLTPFRSQNRKEFTCFYCRHLFDNLDTLREHTRKHKKNEFQKVLQRSQCLVVYADVTDLCCTICNMAIPNLSELKIHLTREHKKNMHLDYNDGVVPFKLAQNNDYECQICGSSFETFRSTETHMNLHFRNYLCSECGKGFVTRCRLKVHIRTKHDRGIFPCEICKKVFSNQGKVKRHVDFVHKSVKRFKCTKCPELFLTHFGKLKHMVEEHGCALLRHKCNLCDKSFKRKYSLSRHLKRDHLGERDFQCHLCSYRFFSNNELKEHMITHDGERRKHECSICKKSYVRRYTLKEHMRIHDNDRRYVCAVCGLAFVQKTALKVHLKRLNH